MLVHSVILMALKDVFVRYAPSAAMMDTPVLLFIGRNEIARFLF